MEPITHLMTGACLARAGFNRKAAYATVAMVVAAELPDIDVLWGIAGPIAAFQHHRGWTHTFLGMPVQAAVVVGLAWLWHRWRTAKEPAKRPLAPVAWGWLFLAVMVALGSHLLLDWTNDYGLRPFFPFNPRWYSGSFVFIFEPVLFVLLLGALVAPSLFGLIGSEVGAKRARFRGRGWAIAALLAMAALWSWRSIEKSKALELVAAQNYSGDSTGAGDGPAAILRIGVSPYPITPYKWHAVIETPQYYQLAVVDTLGGSVTANTQDVLYKPQTTLATLIAKRSWLGEAYLDWSQFPIVQEEAKGSDPDAAGLTTVTFRDLRFMYDVSFLKGREKAPLSGTVTVNGDRKVVAMQMDGRVQR